ncbi:unnamed protein product [Arctogadus glacialis]
MLCSRYLTGDDYLRRSVLLRLVFTGAEATERLGAPLGSTSPGDTRRRCHDGIEVDSPGVVVELDACRAQFHGYFWATVMAVCLEM